MKPVQQVFALVLEKIWEMQKKKGKIANRLKFSPQNYNSITGLSN
jgi:hypothetical protein